MHEVDEQPGGSNRSRPGGVAPSRRRRWIIAGVIAVLIVGALFVFRQAHQPQPQADLAAQSPVATIRTATARIGSMGLYVDALGTVTPLSTINLYSQVNGTVVAVHYAEGQMVRKGEALIDIDPRTYEAQLQEAQGTLQHDRAVLAQAEMDLSRYEEAAGQQAIARQTYEDQRLTVEQYRGTVKNDEGQVKYAEAELSYCHIVSPISGRIGLRLVDPGNVVFTGSSNSIAVITQLQPITVVFNVAEDDLAQVHDEILRRSSLPVDLYDRSQQNKIATGKLLTLDNQVDTSTGTVRFRAQFDNAALGLYPNQFVNARMLVKTLEDAVLIPTAAIQRNGTQAFVYVLAGDTVQMKNVSVLSSENALAAVSGIASGDIVAVSGFDKLQDGAKVKVQNPEAPAAAAPSAAPPVAPKTRVEPGKAS